MKSAGELIKELRKKAGLSQEQFAKKLGYNSKSTINKIENGINDIPYEKLVMLIEEYNLTYKDFKSKEPSLIETNRLILRYLKPSDLKSVFYNYANDDEVTKYLVWPTHRTIKDTKKFFDMCDKEDPLLKKYHYFIETKDKHELIGSCSVVSFINGCPEIGYVIGKKWWNKGIMTEACNKLIEILINDGYKKVVIKANVENIASNRVIEKCGFKFIGKETISIPLKNKEVVCNCYELIKN